MMGRSDVTRYRLRRLESQTGEGTLTIYRSITPGEQPLLQTPMRWVENQPVFELLNETSLNPVHAALFHRAGTPYIPKIWTELAYESTRKEIAPERPSRLEALYAFLDPIEAFSFIQVTGQIKQIWKGNVLEGVPWAVVDMAEFETADVGDGSADGFARAWDSARQRAKAYWTPTTELKRAEVLIAGDLILEKHLDLIEALQDVGILDGPLAPPSI